MRPATRLSPGVPDDTRSARRPTWQPDEGPATLAMETAPGRRSPRPATAPGRRSPRPEAPRQQRPSPALHRTSRTSARPNGGSHAAADPTPAADLHPGACEPWVERVSVGPHPTDTRPMGGDGAGRSGSGSVTWWSSDLARTDRVGTGGAPAITLVDSSTGDGARLLGTAARNGPSSRHHPGGRPHRRTDHDDRSCDRRTRSRRSDDLHRSSCGRTGRSAGDRDSDRTPNGHGRHPTSRSASHGSWSAARNREHPSPTRGEVATRRPGTEPTWTTTPAARRRRPGREA